MKYVHVEYTGYAFDEEHEANGISFYGVGNGTIVENCEAYERQEGICIHCGKHFELEEMEADHITPWKEGGITIAENCQMLCRNCNRVKGGK